MNVILSRYQIDAINRMHNGCILVGGVGTGKSRTALAFYISKVCDGELKINGEGVYRIPKNPIDLYVITTAKKRDSLDWYKEARLFGLSSDMDASVCNIRMVVDSWNNIQNYIDKSNAFFIFDEQRLVGSGAWVKAFYKIASKNKWVMLSATPADVWSDYIPVMVANGYYRNKTDFLRQHAIFNRFTKYPKIDKYFNVSKLESIRDRILVIMGSDRHINKHKIVIKTSYDSVLYLKTLKSRWDFTKNQPFRSAAEYCAGLRKIVNQDSSKLDALYDIYKEFGYVIVFYNYDYELMALREFSIKNGIPYAEWNGHRHEDLPENSTWLYLVQYAAGAEAWECTKTNVIVFFSLTFSYRMLTQAQGRIDRMTTPFDNLYYYYFVSDANIDKSVMRALNNKKNFNARMFAKETNATNFL